MSNAKVRIGYIPLVDAITLVVAVDNGFAAAEGLDAELVREVSWSNVRDKLNIGLFDAAHLLSPMAIASSLGIGHVRVPLIAPFNLGLNGNAITVSTQLFAALSHMADGDIADPIVSARALYRVVAERKARALEPLTFGMTFPFSNHNYQLRFWMAAGGIDPDEDVRLVVLPPPYMVESLVSGHVDGFCVGGPWNSLAVESGVGRILHFGCEIMARASEKVLAVRERWAADNPDMLGALIRALARASSHIDDDANHAAVAAVLARRLDISADLASRTLSGNLRIAPDGTTRTSDRYILIGRNGASRPDPVQAAWLYAQMVRWGQAPLSDELCATAKAVFQPDLYDAVLGGGSQRGDGEPVDGVGGFTGPDFDPSDVASHLAAWSIRRAGRPRLSVVR
jgi:ABC-type nitrate/sulfonate/bicarbonate transport system substrate-binding protein